MCKHGELIENSEYYKVYSVDESKIVPFVYCCFSSVLLVDKRDNKIYIFEDYQDGEIWSDDEVWGTDVICLTDLWKESLGYYEDAYLKPIDRLKERTEYDFDKDDLVEFYSESIDSYNEFIKEFKIAENEMV